MKDEQARVLALLRRFGWNATSFQTLEPGLAYWFDGDEACVAYADTGGAWVAAGAPIATAERLGEVAARFVEAARRRGRRACFFAVEQRFLDATGMRATPIGQQPVWDPHRWSDSLKQARSLREQVRRARAKGVRVRLAAEVSGDDRASFLELAARWVDSRAMAPMGFLVTLDLFGFASERRYVIAEQEGRLVGLLAAIPVYERNGWFFEDILRDPQAPNGLPELLIDTAMQRLAAEGARYATLGLAPLAGPVGPWLGAARACSTPLYNFRGVESFKARLRPQRWDPIYLARPAGLPTPLAFHDVLVAFARGSLLRFGLATLRHNAALRRLALAALALLALGLLLALLAWRFSR